MYFSRNIACNNLLMFPSTDTESSLIEVVNIVRWNTLLLGKPSVATKPVCSCLRAVCVLSLRFYTAPLPYGVLGMSPREPPCPAWADSGGLSIRTGAGVKPRCRMSSAHQVIICSLARVPICSERSIQTHCQLLIFTKPFIGTRCLLL